MKYFIYGKREGGDKIDTINLQDNHKKALNNKITKAINSIPDETIQEIFLDYISNEINNLYSESNFQDIVESQLREIIRDMFIEKGLLKAVKIEESV
jgi:hypothetical protein